MKRDISFLVVDPSRKQSQEASGLNKNSLLETLENKQYKLRLDGVLNKQEAFPDVLTEEISSNSESENEN